MNTTYLVDLENVGVKLLSEHTKHHPDSDYIVFYSDNTNKPDFVLEQIPETVHVTFVDCKTGGNNAMDFCICATAGRLSASRLQKLRILSNDKGYDPMIHLLQEQGIRIARETTTYQPNAVEAPTENTSVTLPSNKEAIIAVIKKYVPKKFQNNMINNFPNAVSRKEAHEFCQALLPPNTATDVYRKIKKYIPKEVI